MIFGVYYGRTVLRVIYAADAISFHIIIVFGEPEWYNIRESNERCANEGNHMPPEACLRKVYDFMSEHRATARERDEIELGHRGCVAISTDKYRAERSGCASRSGN